MVSNGYRLIQGKKVKTFVCRKCSKKVKAKHNGINIKKGYSPQSKKAVVQRYKKKYYGWKLKFYIYDFNSKNIKTIYPKKYLSDSFLEKCNSVEEIVSEYYKNNGCKVKHLYKNTCGVLISGIPDLCVKKSRRIFYVEVKSIGDSLRINQLLFLSIHKGCIVWVCHGGKSINLSKIRALPTRKMVKF